MRNSNVYLFRIHFRNRTRRIVFVKFKKKEQNNKELNCFPSPPLIK